MARVTDIVFAIVCRETNKKTDRQKDEPPISQTDRRQTDNKQTTDRLTDAQTNRQPDRWTQRQKHRQTHRLTMTWRRPDNQEGRMRQSEKPEMKRGNE